MAEYQGLIDQFIRNNESWRILFLPGFSSKDKVTKVSGRGVGLDAVIFAIEEADGVITVNSIFGEGTCFEISIPQVNGV